MSNPSSFPKANPPMHTIALVVGIVSTCLSTLPMIASSIDSIATIDSCVTPLFPHFMSRSALGWIRISISLFIFVISIKVGTEKMVLNVNYLKSSKLRSLPITIKGIKSLSFFTSWSWNTLGLSFLTSGLLALHIDQKLSNIQDDEDAAAAAAMVLFKLSQELYIKIALRTCVILFEIAAPTAMLVSVVVKYVLWPNALKGNGSKGFKQTTILVQHNANIIFALVECGLLGGLKVRFTDMAVAPLFGIIYVLFAWAMKYNWITSGEPQFLYFFLDTTLGKGTSIALIGLLAVLSIFYSIFVLVDDVMSLLGGGVSVHLAVVITVALLTCRFKD